MRSLGGFVEVNGIGVAGDVDSVEESKRAAISLNAEATDSGSESSPDCIESLPVRQTHGFINALSRRFSTKLSFDSTFEDSDVSLGLLIGQGLVCGGFALT